MCLYVYMYIVSSDLCAHKLRGSHLFANMNLISLNWVLDLVSIIVLYCIVLYCIVLCCIVLYCVVLCCIVLYCVVLCCIVLLHTYIHIYNIHVYIYVYNLWLFCQFK